MQLLEIIINNEPLLLSWTNSLKQSYDIDALSKSAAACFGMQ